MNPSPLVTRLLAPTGPVLLPVPDENSQPIVIDGACMRSFLVLLEYDPERAGAPGGAGGVVVLFGENPKTGARTALAVAHITPTAGVISIPAIIVSGLGFPRYSLWYSVQTETHIVAQVGPVTTSGPMRVSVQPIADYSSPTLIVDQRCPFAPASPPWTAPAGLPGSGAIAQFATLTQGFEQTYATAVGARENVAIVKAAPGALVNWEVQVAQASATPLFLLAYDRTTAPGNGDDSVMPPVQIGAGLTASAGTTSLVDRVPFQSGIVLALSTTDTGFTAPPALRGKFFVRFQ